MSLTVALLGNPNSGKTTLFNALTGERLHVGNFPGVTVDWARGRLRFDRSVEVVDLPGTYSLTAFSKEEQVVRDYLQTHPPDALLNIVDATSPARGLYLTLQLIELGIPMAVAMNMMDEVRSSGGSIDFHALSQGLGVPVVPVVASRGEGIEEAARAALAAAVPRKSGLIAPGGTQEQRVTSRYATIEALCVRAVKGGVSVAQRRSFRADTVLTHRLFAFPIFLAVMALVFFLTFGPVGGTLGAVFRRLMDALSLGVGRALTFAGAAAWLRGMIVEGVMTGLGSVLSFLPTILTLFFFLSLLEDSGYMARMAFVTDRLLRRIGLSGRSFVPALLGFGCSVPAILATRTLPTRRDRHMTILLIPFLSCSAKLPIYAVFSQAFFPDHAALVMLCLYLGGALLTVPAGLLLRKTAFPGNPPPFLLELPAYRLPTLRSSLSLVRTRTAVFLRCALTTLLIASVAVWSLQRVNFHLMPVTNSADSALAAIGRAIAPLFLPLGFGNWKAATALLTGLMAKEGVLASLNILLSAPTETALKSALHTAFSPLQALSFLTFTLLYTPCIAAFAAARRELGGFRYALAAAGFQMSVAWLCSFMVYNIGRLLGFT